MGLETPVLIGPWRDGYGAVADQSGNPVVSR